jgi:hypothetical protein
MADVATHVRIFDAAPTDDLVTKRTTVVKDLAAKLIKDNNVDALLAVVDGVTAATAKPGSMPEPLALVIENAIRDQSTAFVRADNDLQLVTMGLLALDQIVANGKASARLSINDVIAAATWLALSFQPASGDPKLEALRSEVQNSARAFCLAAAERARVRKPVGDFKLDALADLTDAHTKIKTAADSPLVTLRENAIIDREELDFLWFALGDFSPLLKRQLSSLSPPTAAIAAGFDAAQKLRRFPAEGHKHLGVRHVRASEPLTLKDLVAVTDGEASGFGAMAGIEKAANFPRIFGLVAAVTHVESTSAGPGKALALTDWAARALLEGGVLNGLSQLSGPKV